MRMNYMLQRTLLFYVILTSYVLAVPALKDKQPDASATPNRVGELASPVPLFITGPQAELFEGSRHTIQLSFEIGTPTEPIDRLFGISFELRYTSSQYVQPINLNQLRSGPFLEPNTFNFAKDEPQRSLVSLAVSRKLGDDEKSGNGTLLSVQFLISENIPAGTEICFSLSNITANDSSGTLLDVLAGPDFCLTVVPLNIEVVPNPFTPNDDGKNDNVEFRRPGGIPPEWKITIMDRSARVVRSLLNGADIWDGTDNQQRALLPGVYLYMIQGEQRILKRGIIGLVR